MTNGTAVDRHERTKRRTATGAVHRRNIVDSLIAGKGKGRPQINSDRAACIWSAAAATNSSKVVCP